MRNNHKSRREFLVGAASVLSTTGLGASFSPSLRGDSQTKKAGTRPAKGRKTSGRIFGVMVDAGRVPELMSYYKKVVDFCAHWGLNAVQFRVADDQGTALRFKSHPDLLTHNNAFTPDEMKGLVEYAQSRNIDIIPELESFGHTGYVTRSAKYADFLDRDSKGSAPFTGVIPVASRTLELFEDLYEELASIFPSPYFHGGCDEVNWGGSELSRKALQEKPREQIWAEYLNSLNRTCAQLRKQFIVWGDFVLQKEPQILAHLHKDVIIMDWNYWDTATTNIERMAKRALDNGSRVMGAPAWGWSRWGPRAGTEQLRNIDAFADTYSRISDPRCLGLVLTNWHPSRYIENSIWDGFAYAAVAFTQGSANAHNSAFKRFVEEHWEAPWNQVWEEVFQLSYDIAPGRKVEPFPFGDIPRLPVPWSNEEEFTAVVKANHDKVPPFTKLVSLLVVCEPSVRRNFEDFQAFQLSMKYLETLFWRNSVLLEEAKKNRLNAESAASLLETIALRDAQLLADLEHAWDEGRPSDSSAKGEPIYHHGPGDQLLFQFRKAAAFSARLVTEPGRFLEMLSSSVST